MGGRSMGRCIWPSAISYLLHLAALCCSMYLKHHQSSCGMNRKIASEPHLLLRLLPNLLHHLFLLLHDPFLHLSLPLLLKRLLHLLTRQLLLLLLPILLLQPPHTARNTAHLT